MRRWARADNFIYRYQLANPNRTQGGVGIPRDTRILFVYGQGLSTFIEKDLDILKAHFDVTEFRATGRFYNYVGRIRRGVRDHDLAFSWFATDQAAVMVFFSRLYRKPSIVTSGGGEVTHMPEIDYGGQLHFKARKLTNYALNKADLVIAISNYTKKETLQVSSPRRLVMIHHGFDARKYRPEGKKERMAITIGGVNRLNLQRKGLDAFVRTAERLPDIPFVLIGRYEDDAIDHLRSIAAPNVRFTGFISLEEMLDYMHRAKVYVQVSGHEGFGLSNAEAMLCGCVPVATRNGALPEVIGDAGIYVPFNDPEATAKAVMKAMRSDKGKDARKRIEGRFPLAKREEEIVEAVESVLSDGR